MTSARYDYISQVFHWLIAAAIVATYSIGLYREDLPKDDFRVWLMSLHMSIGLLVIGLGVLRIGWRSFNPAPAPVPMAKPLALASRAAHLGLYVAMFAIPVIGLLAAWAKGRTIGFFGLFPIPTLIPIDKGSTKVLEEAHEIAAHMLMILAGLHAAAAIFHQIVLKDGTLARMLPFLRTARVASAE